MMDSIDGFVDGFVVPDVDGFIVASNIKIVDNLVVHRAFQYLQKNKDTNPIFTSSNFCHGWISRHNTINEYIHEALNKYPDVVEIRINLGVNYFRYVKFNGSWHHSWDKSDLSPEPVLCVSEIKNLIDQRLIPLEKSVAEIHHRNQMKENKMKKNEEKFELNEKEYCILTQQASNKKWLGWFTVVGEDTLYPFVEKVEKKEREQWFTSGFGNQSTPMFDTREELVAVIKNFIIEKVSIGLSPAAWRDWRETVTEKD